MSEHASTAEPQPRVDASEVASESGGFNLRRDAAFFLLAASVFALDQLTKFLIRGWLERGEAWPDHGWMINIVNVSNSGAAFGILQGQTVFLVVMSLVGVAAIFLYYMFPPLEHGLLRAALALQLGGAAGNMIDRVRVGEVTDFVNFRHFPAFNVADASISIGVVTIIAFFLFIETERFRQPPAEGGG